jgi:hypothetical protein
MTHTFLRSVVLLLAAALAAVALPATARAAPYCGITGESRVKQGTQDLPSVGSLVEVRAGRHTRYDRLVLDIRRTT